MPTTTFDATGTFWEQLLSEYSGMPDTSTTNCGVALMWRALKTVLLFLILLGGPALFVAPELGGFFRHSFFVFQLMRAEPQTPLLVPVAGVRRQDLRDSWNAPRPGGRRHQGIDIFARRNTPVRSTTLGIVATVGTNALGGQIVRILGPGGEWHYYAHLERFAAIQKGDIVTPGTVLGYVGNSGNARGTPPHLHYGIYQSRGGAINPYPRFTGSTATTGS